MKKFGDMNILVCRLIFIKFTSVLITVLYFTKWMDLDPIEIFSWNQIWKELMEDFATPMVRLEAVVKIFMESSGCG